MLLEKPLLVILLELVERIPQPAPPRKPKRGRPKVYSDKGCSVLKNGTQIYADFTDSRGFFNVSIVVI